MFAARFLQGVGKAFTMFLYKVFYKAFARFLHSFLNCLFAVAASHALGSFRSIRSHLLMELRGSADVLGLFRLPRR